MDLNLTTPKNHIIITIIFFCLCFSVFTGTAKSQEAEEIINNLQKTYKATKTIQAEFKQESILQSLNQKQFAEGKVVIKKPGKMKWEYEKPEKQLIIINDKQIYIFVPEDNQVIKDTMDDMFSSNAPTTFLSGDADLKKKFDISYDKDAHYSGAHKLILTPRTQHPGMTKLVLIVNSKTYQIEKSSVYDIYGNVTTLHFSNMIINKEISDDIFKFTIPDGAEVVSPPKF